MINIATLSVGAWITLAVVEHAITEDKKRLSDKLRDRTYFEIIDNITSISQSIYRSIPCGLTQEEINQIDKINDTIRDKTHNYKNEGKIAAEAIGELTVLLNDAHNNIIKECGTASKDQSERYIKQIMEPYKSVKFDLDVYRTVLLPRVFDFSENIELRDSLIYFEMTSLKYEKYMQSFDDPKYVTKPLQIFGTIIGLLNGAANIYWFIVDDLEKDSKRWWEKFR